MERVHLVSLGCAKNRVDSEVMVGLLQQEEFQLVDDPAEADVIVVNTCSFIEPATEESIETVLEMGELKEAGRCKRLVVTGCLVQRYGQELEGELPEVDHFLGTGEYHRIAEILQSRAGEAARSYVDVPRYMHDEQVPRVNSWSSCSAFLKIAEGCDHQCAFCIIPKLRGQLRSRTIPSLVAEAERLAAEGVVELNLVSQDSTAYGRDLRDGTGLGGLLHALCGVDGVEWIRLHYAYPIGLPAGLLEALRDEPKVVPYLDIPLQHASGRMLKAMRRGVTRDGQDCILDRVREYVPDITVRTTFIVGFPGETDEDFAELCDFVKRQRFDHLGVFTYSREEGTPAAEMAGQVPEHVMEARRRRLMEIQNEISREKLQSLVGQVVPVLVEGVSEESDLLLRGRMDRQAPEVDGQVFITNPSLEVQIGQIRPLKVVQAGDYDLVGELVAATPSRES
jgi:ribosomal protein S12 methylthiotransferase